MDGYESALNDLEIEITVLEEFNSELEFFTVMSMIKSMMESDEEMKKEGIRDEVAATVDRMKAAKDADSRRAIVEDVESRLEKGDKVVAYSLGGVIWPQIREKKTTSFVREMGLVYLVSQFEGFVQKVISLSLKRRPRIIEKKSISFGELSSLGNLQEALETLAEKEASERVNEGIDSLAEYLSGVWNVRLADYEKWSLFRERFYRRNIIIHNGGRPDRRYRERTGYTGNDPTLVVEKEYLQESLQLFREIALLIFSKLSTLNG